MTVNASTTRAKRTHPRMASDVFRTIVLVLVSAPIGIWIDEVLPQALVGIDRAALEDAASYLAWAVFAVLWATWTLVLFGRQDSATMHRWLRETTPKRGWRRVVWGLFGGGGVYWAVVGSLAAIVNLISAATQDGVAGRPLLVFTGFILVVCSLTLTIVAFAIRYAREVATNGGLSFPDTPEPRLADYLYFSAHLSVSLGGADVVVGSTSMRRIVTTHTMMSYAYNTLVLGLLVSLLLEAFV